MIEAMKQMVEAIDGLLDNVPPLWEVAEEGRKALDAGRQAIAEAEKQMPVEVVIKGKLGNIYSFTSDYNLKKGDKLYTTPPASQKPLTDEQKESKFKEWESIPASWSWGSKFWFYAGIAYAEASHNIKE